MEFPKTSFKDSSHGIVGTGWEGGLVSKQCLDICTALSYSKNSRAGLGMPARPKLLRYHLRPLANHSMKAGPGRCL